MTESRNYLQKYAMHFGTYMGIYWTLKFILVPLGFTIPFLMSLYSGLTLAVPFMGYYYVKIYRDKVCGGTITFAHSCFFTLFMYMFASLLVAVAHYLYFQFIDHGLILEEYSKAINQFLVQTPGMETEKLALKNILESLYNLTPIDITMQLLSFDVFSGSLLAIPTALFVMKQNKNQSMQDKDASNRL